MMDEIDINIHAVALAGGSGTRFWPFSRKVKPKQLLPLGRNGETLLNATLERFRSLVPPERWWLVVGESHARDCIEAIPEVNPDQVLIEPIARNTAPAIALAAATLARRDPDAVMVVLPADHFVVNEDAFVAAVHTAAKVAQNGAIVTLGIEPDRAEIGYGYIERGGPDERGEGAFRVERFREKPTRELAREYLSRGGFYWNA
ncbi:NTP transferase domain-containing protein, partial [Myxococcota bacterium]|nr:NTP transferase domain-containing protein [Myxococcota bacterium]